MCLAVRLPSAIALFEWFPSILREPLGASVTLWEATAPVKLPTYHCPSPGLLHVVRNPVTKEWYPKVDSMNPDELTSMSPTYPVHPLPKSNIRLQSSSTGSFRPVAGNGHLHPNFNFTESLVETAPKSLRHSCGSELTRQGISLP